MADRPDSKERYTAQQVFAAVVEVILDRFDDPYSGDPVLSESQARLIAGTVLERLDHAPIGQDR